MPKNKKDKVGKLADSLKADPIDLGNTKQLVDDIWLFLTNKPLYQQATIKREAFDHEVGVMIDTVREYERNKALQGLSVMSPKQFQQFLHVRRVAMIRNAAPDKNDTNIDPG